jgi:hypothetical protein
MMLNVAPKDSHAPTSITVSGLHAITSNDTTPRTSMAAGASAPRLINRYTDAAVTDRTTDGSPPTSQPYAMTTTSVPSVTTRKERTTWRKTAKVTTITSATLPPEIAMT